MIAASEDSLRSSLAALLAQGQGVLTRILRPFQPMTNEGKPPRYTLGSLAHRDSNIDIGRSGWRNYQRASCQPNKTIFKKQKECRFDVYFHLIHLIHLILRL